MIWYMELYFRLLKAFLGLFKACFSAFSNDFGMLRCLWYRNFQVLATRSFLAFGSWPDGGLCESVTAVCRSVDGRRIQTLDEETDRKTHIQWENSLRVANGTFVSKFNYLQVALVRNFDFEEKAIVGGGLMGPDLSSLALTTALACSWDQTLLSSTLFAMIFESHMMFADQSRSRIKILDVVCQLQTCTIHPFQFPGGSFLSCRTKLEAKLCRAPSHLRHCFFIVLVLRCQTMCHFNENGTFWIPENC